MPDRLRTPAAVEGVALLRRGVEVIKFSRAGRPSVVVVKLSATEDELQWSPHRLHKLVAKAHRSLLMASVDHMLIGRDSMAFRRATADARGSVHLSLSLVLQRSEGDGRETFDLCCADEECFGLLVAVFRALIGECTARSAAAAAQGRPWGAGLPVIAAPNAALPSRGGSKDDVDERLHVMTAADAAQPSSSQDPGDLSSQDTGGLDELVSGSTSQGTTAELPDADGGSAMPADADVAASRRLLALEARLRTLANAGEPEPSDAVPAIDRRDGEGEIHGAEGHSGSNGGVEGGGDGGAEGGNDGGADDGGEDGGADDGGEDGGADGGEDGGEDGGADGGADDGADGGEDGGADDGGGDGRAECGNSGADKEQSTEESVTDAAAAAASLFASLDENEVAGVGAAAQSVGPTAWGGLQPPRGQRAPNPFEASADADSSGGGAAAAADMLFAGVTDEDSDDLDAWADVDAWAPGAACLEATSSKKAMNPFDVDVCDSKGGPPKASANGTVAIQRAAVDQSRNPFATETPPSDVPGAAPRCHAENPFGSSECALDEFVSVDSNDPKSLMAAQMAEQLMHEIDGI